MLTPLAGRSATETLLIIGDSLSAGYGIRSDAAWPALLQQRLRNQGLDYNVANLSVSGETTAGGLSRLPAALERHRPRVVIIALGANDGLRGLPLAEMRANLEAMIAAAGKRQARILLVGMRLPPNYGHYADNFAQVFIDIVKTKKLAHVDFLLAGIAEHPQFFQSDGLHPTSAAQPRLLDNIWPALKPLLRQTAS